MSLDSITVRWSDGSGVAGYRFSGDKWSYAPDENGAIPGYEQDSTNWRKFPALTCGEPSGAKINGVGTYWRRDLDQETICFVPAGDGYVPVRFGGDPKAEQWLETGSRTARFMVDNHNIRFPIIPSINYQAHGLILGTDFAGRKYFYSKKLEGEVSPFPSINKCRVFEQPKPKEPITKQEVTNYTWAEKACGFTLGSTILIPAKVLFGKEVLALDMMIKAAGVGAAFGNYVGGWVERTGHNKILKYKEKLQRWREKQDQQDRHSRWLDLAIQRDRQWFQDWEREREVEEAAQRQQQLREAQAQAPQQQARGFPREIEPRRVITLHRLDTEIWERVGRTFFSQLRSYTIQACVIGGVALFACKFFSKVTGL